MTNGVNARRGRPGYDLPSLLAVAVQVFNEQGYDATSMDDLAKRLGISKSAIYHHVRGKEELLGLAIDRALDALFAIVEQAEAGSEPAITRLRSLVRSSVELLIDELPYVTLLLRVRGNTAVERSALNRRREFDARVSSLMAQAMVDGDVRQDIDPTLTSRLLFGLVNSVTEWYRSQRDGKTSTAIVDTIMRIAFEGISTRRQ